MPKNCESCNFSYDGRFRKCPECVRVKQQEELAAEEETDEILFDLDKSLKEIHDDNMADKAAEEKAAAGKQELELRAAKEEAAIAKADMQKLSADLEKLKKDKSLVEKAEKAARTKLEAAKMAADKATAEAGKLRSEVATLEAGRKEEPTSKGDPKPTESPSDIDRLVDKLEATIGKLDKFVTVVAGKQDGGEVASDGAKFNFTNRGTPPGVDPGRGGCV